MCSPFSMLTSAVAGVVPDEFLSPHLVFQGGIDFVPTLFIFTSCTDVFLVAQLDA